MNILFFKSLALYTENCRNYKLIVIHITIIISADLGLKVILMLNLH
jgi:hypothetical protein